MSLDTSQFLAVGATAYGVLAALFQTQQMLTRRCSCDVSARFFAAYAGGYAIWLLYGINIGSVPLILVDAVGLLSGGVTLVVALSPRVARTSRHLGELPDITSVSGGGASPPPP
jgi:uncharacterized protein with PQ loop repeat